MPAALTAGSETSVFRFSQPQPISTYLLALAVGDLVSRDLSARSRVWSEPATVDAGAWEFAGTGKFLDTAEEISGPYPWGRYDLLLLPPSFPYGGELGRLHTDSEHTKAMQLGKWLPDTAAALLCCSHGLSLCSLALTGALFFVIGRWLQAWRTLA